ncbi:MAG: hypothetical protein KGI38_11340 [Thaumarchaeota archaeon]|nr:hypothetical protein [Nitrososphaerota archaeon]
MTEGDYWVNATGTTLHIEKRWKFQGMGPGPDLFNGVIYWCGMRSPSTHERRSEYNKRAAFPQPPDNLCERCKANRAKAAARAKPVVRPA